jgi:7-cyano-7-deazaguanine synthase
LIDADSTRAIVVLSGGQDSATCLYWAIDRYGADHVESVTFDYGQRHRIELESAARVADFAGVANTVLPIDTFAALGGDALTDADVPVRAGTDAATGLPNTFVPGRNLVFLTYAAAFAYRRGVANLVTGVAQTDYSGYPDCREVEMARDLGALPAMALTHTCYNGERPPCGACPACQLRAKGFAEAGIEDPLLAAT